ncbi:V-set and Ig domain-containing protein [Esox lucius]|uniref:Ig-like domain-containing protein n=1 Tax=Esox lucius TaxID=8010 RepID=A0AAY5LCT3_ESOLU|nr:V-set and Ig domain-containing protein [Esox lucius]
MDAWSFCTMVNLLLCFVEGLSAAPSDEGWSMKVQAEVRAMEGYPVVLPCSFSHPHHTLHSSLKVVWRLGHGHGSTVLYHCSSPTGTRVCQPDPEQDQRYRLEGNPREHDLSLRISSVGLQDNGRYFCRVEAPGHQHASYEDKMGTRLRVEAAPRILGLSVTGSEVTGYRAQCRVQGSPLPDIQWLDHNKLLDGSNVSWLMQVSPGQHQHTSQLLEVLPGQQYTCTASNPLGKDQATLYMLPPRQVYVSGDGPPLLLLVSLSLGAKVLLLLLAVGAWQLQGGGLAWTRSWFK